MAKDRFHEYIDHCEKVEPISPGDFIEKFAPHERLAWTRLIRDVQDTFNAGRLRKVKTTNGGVGYVRNIEAKAA